MIYRGQVQGDVIVLSDGIRLPEGIEVLVEPLIHPISPPSLAGVAIRNGVPIFPKSENVARPDLEFVNALRDEAP
jgi:hypothetical protein